MTISMYELRDAMIQEITGSAPSCEAMDFGIQYAMEKLETVKDKALTMPREQVLSEMANLACIAALSFELKALEQVAPA